MTTTVPSPKALPSSAKTRKGTTYSLKITENLNRAAYAPQQGDGYVLTLSGTRTGTSSGTITGKASDTYTLSAGGNVTISAGTMTDISGTITLSGGGTAEMPGEVTPKITVGPVTYTVAYDANGGDGSMADSQHTYDTAKNLSLNTFTRENYEFIGWAITSGGAVEYTDGQSVTNLTTTQGATVTLYAVWQLDVAPFNYAVAYDANGGSGSMVSSEHTYGTAKNLSANTFTRTGYTFTGWAAVPGGAVVYTNGQSVINLTEEEDATVTLYAVWAGIAYYVAYNANDGVGSMAPSSYTYGTAKNLSANTFTRAEYTFDGWATSSGGAKVYTDEQSVSNLTTTQGATVTLFAVWKSNLTLVSGYSFGDKISWLYYNAENDTHYLIEVNEDVTNFYPSAFFYEAKTNVGITIIGTGDGERTLNFNANDGFVVAGDLTLTLENITLKAGPGISISGIPLVEVVDNGHLIMKTGARLIDKNNTYNDYDDRGGGGVRMNGENARFTMYDGEISNNTSIRGGGGVRVYKGTFTMYDGEISGNEVPNPPYPNTSYSGYGGGVFLSGNGAHFIMHGGKIINNKTRGISGGGVGVIIVNGTGSATFTMYDGEISGNYSPYDGGGVYVMNFGTFTMHGGEIFKNSIGSGSHNGGGVAASAGTFRMSGGTIYGTDDSGKSNFVYTDTAALYVDTVYATAEYGTYNGTFSKTGNLESSDTTVKVIGGVLQ